MSSSMLIVHIWTTKPDALDWAAGEALFSTLTEEELDPEGFLTDEWTIGDEFTHEQAVEHLRAYQLSNFLFLRGIWTGDESANDVSKCEMGPVTVVITAGLSYGGYPTDSFGTLNDLPEPVLRATGFFQ